MGATAQHRQAGVTAKLVAAHLAVSVPMTALIFGALGPAIGTFLLFLPGLVAKPDGAPFIGFLLYFFGYRFGGPAAIATGALIAIISPFIGSSKLFRLLGILAGAAAEIVWLSLLVGTSSVVGLLFLAVIGAASAAICTQIVWNWPLRRDNSLESRTRRRDRLAKARAQRLRRESEVIAQPAEA
jgi:hypothetical protein